MKVAIVHDDSGEDGGERVLDIVDHERCPRRSFKQLLVVRDPTAQRRMRRVEERLERQALNEDLMRTVNDRIATLSERATGWAAPEQTFEFQCECGRTSGCDGHILMTLAEYELVRRQRDRFAVIPGHETDEIERMVQQDERYVIVDKCNEVEHLVE